jgi:hypothetical protein
VKLDALLSTIILVAFLVTIIMAVGSYVAYKLREGRRPSPGSVHPPALTGGDSPYFERIEADDEPNAPPEVGGARW